MVDKVEEVGPLKMQEDSNLNGNLFTQILDGTNLGINISNIFACNPNLTGAQRLKINAVSANLFEKPETYRVVNSLLTIPSKAGDIKIVTVSHELKGDKWQTSNFSSLSSFVEGLVVQYYQSQGLIPVPEDGKPDTTPLIVTIHGRMVFDTVVLAPELKGIGSRVLTTYRITNLRDAEQEKVMMDGVFRAIDIPNPIYYVITNNDIRKHFQETVYSQLVKS